MSKKKLIIYVFGSALLLAVLVLSFIYFGLNQIFSRLVQYEREHENRIIKDSKYLGQEVLISSYAKLAKVRSFTTWKNQYHYLVPDYSEDIEISKKEYFDIQEIDSDTKFKVIEVRSRIEGPAFSIRYYCILNDMDSKGLKFITDCKALRSISLVTEILSQAKTAFTKNKKVSIGVIKSTRPENEKYIFEVNNVGLFPVSNKDELLTILGEYRYGYRTLFQELYNSFPFILNQQSFKEAEFYTWQLPEFEFYKFYIPEETFNMNILSPEVLSWITKKEPDSMIRRWAITQVIIHGRRSKLTKYTLRCLDNYVPKGNLINAINDFNKTFNEKISVSDGYDNSCQNFGPPLGDEKRIIPGLLNS